MNEIDRFDDGKPPVPRVGTAGWSVPLAMAGRFPASGTHLERYGTVLNAVEINTSFYRPHRRATYARWAQSVPAAFRFSVKLPKSITHEARLRDCAGLVERFAEEVGGLGGKLGPVLVQLPPSFAFPGDAAERFFEDLAAVLDAAVVLEPRHASWFTPEVEAVLVRRHVARVAADPARPPDAKAPGGRASSAYFRLHGSPRIYESAYDRTAVEDHAAAVRGLGRRGVEVWTIYDNTMHGAATRNACELADLLGRTGA